MMKFLAFVLAGCCCLSLECCVAEGHQRTRNSDGSRSRSRRSRQLGQTVQQIMTSFQEAKARLIQGIKKDYGEQVYAEVFEDINLMDNSTATTTIGRNAFFLGTINAHTGWERIKRKLMILILGSQISNTRGKFIWATAGAQEAAARGNFFEQQYTNVLRHNMQNVFAAVGIQLETRPYAMGAVRSAPEIATCAKEIFGDDIDLISYDFTEARHYWRLEMFAHRVARMDKHPALLVLQSEENRRQVCEHLAELGMAVLRTDTVYLHEKLMQFPDSDSQMTLDSMTDHVKYFRCGKSIEAGKTCSEYKFTHNGTCDDREYQTRWHPGWKLHAFQGNLYSLFLTEILGDALGSIEKQQGQDPAVLLDQLKTQIDQEYEAFKTSKDFLYGDKWSLETIDSSATAHQLADAAVFCHTARLPAQARFMGYITDNPFPDGMDDFDRGAPLADAVRYQVDHPLLTWDESEYGRGGDCSINLRNDYKDFFLVNSNAGDFQNMLVPNDIENDVYGGHTPMGIILICGAGCELGSCPDETLPLEAVEDKKVLVKVNGVEVDQVIPYEDCYLLAQNSGNIRWSADENMQFNIGFKVEVPKKYIRIGSVIIW